MRPETLSGGTVAACAGAGEGAVGCAVTGAATSGATSATSGKREGQARGIGYLAWEGEKMRPTALDVQSSWGGVSGRPITGDAWFRIRCVTDAPAPPRVSS